MCGFAGVVAWDDRYRVDRETLRRMSARVAHRGPDGEGYHLNHEQEVTPDRPQVGLAFRRLAILDPDPRAMQPFTIGDKTIVFNGEIYNFRELRAELSKLRPDYPWRTTGDTEVLLLAYEVWGKESLERLNGMFAFAVWDGARQELFLARDRMGQKPLYYSAAPQGRAIAFASEMPALRPVGWLDWSTPDPLALELYFRFGYFESMTTIYPAVERLPPGARTCYTRSGGDGPWGYFNGARPSAGRPHAPKPDAAAAGETRRLVTQAVRRQLVSDVPLGCFLSGGIDSSVIAAAMKAAAGEGQDVLTFSIGFDDPRYDETEHAARVAAHLGTRHRRFVVRPDAAEDLPRIAAVFGEPFADSSALPTHYLARETRRHVKVALSGDGGDELFGGYDRYRAMALAQRLPGPLRAVAAARLWQALPGSHPKSWPTRLKRFLAASGLPPGARYASYVSLFDPGALRELLGLGPDAPDIATRYIAAGVDQYMKGGRDVVQAVLSLDRITYLPDDLLAKVDRASMLHALEVRSPFMDHELVEFAAGLTTDQLLKGGPKRMLREAFAQDLPAWVFKRKKMGFAVPIGDWFRDDPRLRAMLHDHLFAADSFAKQHFQMKTVQRLVDEHETRRQDHSQRLYALLMLELWWRLQS